MTTTDAETLKRAKTEVEKEEPVKTGEEKTVAEDAGVSTPPETEAEVVDDEIAVVENKVVETEVGKGRPRRATKGKKIVLAESSSEDEASESDFDANEEEDDDDEAFDEEMSEEGETRTRGNATKNWKHNTHSLSRSWN